MTEIQQKRQKLWALFGDLPDRHADFVVKTVSREKITGGTLEILQCQYIEEEPFEAFLALPDKGNGTKVPAVLYNHSHGSRYFAGKEEVRTPAPYQYRAWLPDLLNAGYAVFAGDHRAFGSRAQFKESEIFKEMLWKGQVMWGMMVYDSVRMLDYLCSRSEIDSTRIATLGMSMGSTMAWYLAAVDERIKVCVDICCLTDFEELIRMRGLDRHGVYYFIPGLLKQFDTASINALIAPRAHFAAEGLLDGLTPEAGLDKIDRVLKQVYADAGHPENWRLKKYPVQHQETVEMRADILAYLREKL